MFLRRFNLYFSRYVFPLNSDNFSDWDLFPTVALVLIFSVILSLFYHLIFRDISLKSQEPFILFPVMFCSMEFYYFSFHLSCALELLFIRLFVRLFIRLFIRYFFIWASHYLFYLFELFSCLIIFIRVLC